MSDDTQQPIIIKRIKKGGGSSHGGAWKIAYADFVTAMMAFFLLMWLLGSTSQGDLSGIADHFQNPLRVAMQGGSGTGDSSSVILGGGEDLSRTVGQVRRGEVRGRQEIALDASRPRPLDADFDAELRERGRLIDVKGKIEAIIEADPVLRGLRHQIRMDITTEGLRIQIVDAQNRPMFASASAELQPYTRTLLRAIGPVLNEVDNTLSLSGHTDAAPFAGGERGYSNWELSTSRANTSRRELLAGGLASGKVVRVVGVADTIPFNQNDPYDAANRRISIIVMNKKTEQAFRAQGVEQAPPVPQEGSFEFDGQQGMSPEEIRQAIEQRARQPEAFQP